MIRRLLIAVGLLAFALPVWGASSQQAAADTTTTITLHKRLHRDVRENQVADWQYDNQGQEVNVADGSQGLNGVQFEVYAADTLYEQAKHSGETQGAFTQRIAQMSRQAVLAMVAKYQLQRVQQLTTQTVGGEAGVARLAVPSNEASYLIVETGLAPEAGISVDENKKATPLLINLPVMVAGQPLAEVHIYPKNVGYVRDPFFFKYGVRLDGSQVRLAGAVFALYRRDAAGNKLYLDTTPPSGLKNSWTAAEQPLTAENVARFTSNKAGLVDLGERYLPGGHYYFEELKAPPGYRLATTPIEVVVPDSWYDENGKFLPVLVAGQAADAGTDGVVQAETVARGQPQVANYQRPALPDASGAAAASTGSRPVKPAPGGWLPSVGSRSAWLAIVIGLLLIGLAWWLTTHRRRQH